MGMRIIHKKTNKISSCIYSYWVHDIVKKGLVEDYSILEYPDIVKLIMIDVNGEKINEKITERKDAESKLNSSPDQYLINEIDIKRQFQNDILKSKKLNNQSFFFFLVVLKNRIATIRLIKKDTMKKIVIGVIIAIFGTVSAYAIMKYGFKWF